MEDSSSALRSAVFIFRADGLADGHYMYRKYQQTQANLEKNREREDAGYSGGDRERGDDDEAKDAHTTGQC